MTYPPGSPGYPPAQSSGSYGAPAASLNKADNGESNLQHYLTIAVLALGLLIYLFSYGPLITHVLPNGDELVEKDPLPIGLSLLAGLLAGVSLLPKAKDHAAVGTVVAAVGALLLIEDAIGASGRGWALWAAIVAGVVQAALALSVLLLEAGVITPPAPRPKYDHQYGHYGQYSYYGQQQAPYQQSGYGAQYGGYPSGTTTGGFSAQPSTPQSSQHGSPTPPTGFPSFSPPPSSANSGTPGQGNSSEHSGQRSFGQGQQPQAPSSPSGPSQS